MIQLRKVRCALLVSFALLLLPQVGQVPSAGSTGFKDFVRGDCNMDTEIDLADPIFLLNCLFLGGPCGTCSDACDSNDDDVMDLSDAIYTLSFTFLGGPPPPLPFPTCGPDPATPWCVAYLPCGC